MEFESGRQWMGRLESGADLWEWMERFGKANEIRSGWISAIGAVRRAVLAWYDQEGRTYLERRFDEPMEIVSCSGNFSLKEAVPFPHIHVVLSGRDLRCVGGHLLPGTEVFLVEYRIRELAGRPLERSQDDDIGLPVWPANP
jgi:predicted DNA-binding protein with PD1-like motif